ncbi:MAG: rhomboid family intramembrane serine protease [Altibacter sp.]|uniref:rhomboid family intramembrane serine protease n=1 Tax=Altibacter lentus TaxID=1223410 RepID=UPI000556BB80|nr:rhomboid family intramembrane serine protease [Altibacter lentus]MCW8980225.1 rhomboid family intramembrane serine protease [Altibacter sp.]
MATKNQLYFSNEVIGYPILFVGILWIVFWAEMRFGWNFNFLGIFPQRLEGLRGVVFGPMVHSSLKHLFNNSVPLLVLTTALFYFYRSIRWKVLVFGLLITGVLTWLIGRPALHIGASGVVYMLAAFLFFKGVFSKQFQLTALAFIVVFLYGSLLWYVFPIDPKISWEGHLSGFAVGIVFAFLFKEHPITNKKYEWEQQDYNEEDDPFLKHFDENGNFIEQLPEEEEPLEESPRITVRYTLRKDASKDTDV